MKLSVVVIGIINKIVYNSYLGGTVLNSVVFVHVDAFVHNSGNSGYSGRPFHNSRHLGIRTNVEVPPVLRKKSICNDKCISISSYSRKAESTDNVITLSEDPGVYLIRNILSAEECQSYIDRATQKNTDNDIGDENDGDETTQTMQRSNAPQASIKISGLWPLPFLCLGAGVPSILRLLALQESSSSPPPTYTDLFFVALPPVTIAAATTATLLLSVMKAMNIYAQSASRTSESLALNSRKDVEFIRPLVERVGTAVASLSTSTSATAQRSKSTVRPPSTISWKNWEAPVVTRYTDGQSFASHNDASPTRGSEWSELGGQRTVTAITYLNTCTEGGGTKFDRLGFTVMPQQGSTLVFYPADSETWEADERTIHEGTAAVEEKFIVQMFGRGLRVPPPLGIPDCYGD